MWSRVPGPVAETVELSGNSRPCWNLGSLGREDNTCLLGGEVDLSSRVLGSAYAEAIGVARRDQDVSVSHSRRPLHLKPRQGEQGTSGAALHAAEDLPRDLPANSAARPSAWRWVCSAQRYLLPSMGQERMVPKPVGQAGQR